MKLTKTFGPVAVACSLVALCATDAAAQAPTLSSTQNNGRVQIQWTPLAEATGYDILVSGTLNGLVSVPASTTFVDVAAPPGSYNIQVRGTAGAVQGPFSNLITVNVGGGGSTPAAGCGALSAPTLTVNTNGATATFNWSPVAGAAGYRLQIGQTPGSTQLQQDVPPTQTSYGASSPFFGTFYARVLAGDSCGALVSSPEVAFTIAPPAPGTTARTPDPAAGTLIPRASLGYALAIIEQVANAYRGDLLNSCREFGGNNTFLFRVVQALRQRDSRWGLNDKRGHPNDMSQDILAYNPTNRPDQGEGQIYLFDIIAGHCTGNPDVWMNDVTDVTWAGGSSGICGNQFCARWTLEPYLRSGFQP